MAAAGKYRQRFTRLKFSGVQEQTYGSIPLDFEDDWTIWGYVAERSAEEIADDGNTWSEAHVVIHLRAPLVRQGKPEIAFQDQLREEETGEIYYIDGVRKDLALRELLVDATRGRPARKTR